VLDQQTLFLRSATSVPAGRRSRRDRRPIGARYRLGSELFGDKTTSSSGPDWRISAAIFSAQLMQTPARSIPQPVQLQLDL
jgi:hypothetical protein